ncbi:tRNA pseudouridine synthase D [Myxococcus stipitatus DSM 14675]|uniref:tRNA pseudouridine synthase D n=1 Tax=Myxococcus stipitatus (strain DSM 14675 / JCM 12634 / Mx s8) TaxID=1278073 RepID=L7UFN6_MYXSD|nr:tRNA pseudouridine(13) synthase TruD [Myxococcus stipitatus]AGC45264.1 tRNA pseudouridine synthase D [Myxococcus stipitatus DSM 14675]
MRIKQKPEDFSVKESYRFDEVSGGRFRVYLMDKQKLSTFDAVTRLRDAFGLRPGAISYCGLKDKQGRTEQLIAVDGADVDMQEPDLRLKYLGRTNKALSSANITSNRFSVTVRSLGPESLGPLNVAAAEVNRLGVVNYFDSQRFGSLKHGQGFIAKDLIRGDFEAALHNYLAKPSDLDRSEDAKVKAFWRDNWGKWDSRVPFEGTKKYHRVLRSLREEPKDFARAFLQIDSDYRAMQLFTYQSYLWNEGVRRYLQILLPRESLFPMRYQAGTLLFHRDADPETLRVLRDATFPLLAPDTRFTDPKVEEAVRWVLGREKLQLSDLTIPGAERMLFFKHEERPVLSFPHKLVIGRAQADELNRGHVKSNVAFTLPPGAYATLVVKRLFHFEYTEDTPEEIRASQRPKLVELEQAEAAPSSRRGPPVRESRGGTRDTRAPRRESRDDTRSPRRESRDDDTRAPRREARAGARDATERASTAKGSGRTSTRSAAPKAPAKAAPPVEEQAPSVPLGFREKQRQRKAAREVARAETAAKRPKSRKK